MIYFDTAYILKCYVHESGSPVVRRLLLEHQTGACCALGKLEFAAAVKRAIREGRLDARVLDTVFSVFERDNDCGVWSWLPLSSHLVEIASLAIRSLPADIFIRSADALHLVCARENGFSEIYSNDRHVINAAPHFGIQATNIIT
jgi:predicted nucleic acid-binding protein